MSDNQPNLATPVTEQPSTLASPPTETGQAATSESPKVAATPRPKVPNPEQQAAIDQILQFIADPDPGHNFFILSGGAGTGKTFCMSSVQSALRGSRTNLAFTAPTNKAAKVLKGVVGYAKTIYSLLGLRIDTSGELKQIVAGEYTDLSDVDVIVLDEASMVNKHLIRELKEHVNDGRLKIIFMGDNAQLPPVGEVSSPIWTEKNVPLAQLLKVERHDNQILKLVTHIREQVFLPQTDLKLQADNDGQEGVWKINKQAFKMKIYDDAVDGAFSDTNGTKVISWRNIKVAEYNDLIRLGIFGEAAIPGYYLPGDRVIATAPCKRGEELILATDEEAVVESVRDSQHPVEPKYKISELKCTTEDGRTIRLCTLHPHSAELFNKDCEELAHAARKDGRLWRKFWLLKELFHEVKYGYAITAHRAQGSTYGTVYVDTGDILLNRSRREALQCLYVATSRPTTRLILT